MPSDIKPIEQEARLSSYDLAKNWTRSLSS